MEASAQRERVVNWKILRRRLARPLLWLVLIALAVGGVAGAVGAKWLEPEAEPPPGGFQFHEVFVVEGSTKGNFSRFRIVPWMSNTGEERLGSMRLVVYVLESDRYIVRNESSLEVGNIPPRRTVNTSTALELNNTKSYEVRILAFEDDYLVARGIGSIGFRSYYGYEGSADAALLHSRVTLSAGQFSYEYSP